MPKLVCLALVCIIALSSACITIVQPGGDTSGGATTDRSNPSAYIDLISPSSLAWGQEVSFTGHGTAPSGSITAYRWRSSIDGDLSSRPTFTTSTLSPGNHIILFSVQNDAGNWSLETQGTVNVTTESTGDGAPPPEDGGTATTPPVINAFNADPAGITAGAGSTLSWSVTNAIAVTIDNGVGSVGLTGTRVVSPATDTTYTLTAANTAYYSQATAKVTVAAAATPKPDLIIEDIWKSSDHIYYRIKNQGTASAPATVTKLTIDGAVKSTDSVPSLAAGAASTQYFSSYSYTCSGVSDSIVVTADSTGLASESNEANNSMTTTFSCLVLGPVVPPLMVMKPDLKITNISYDAGKVKFTVKNEGALNSGGFDVKLYRNGVYKDTVTISGGIVAGGQATFTFPAYHHICVLGSHDTMKVTADTGGTISESDETNNSRSEYWGCPPSS
ncbi:MAG: CARDB domain-containing protein [Dehalococcoidia bacterium]|jgi:hypothetical protein